MRRRERYSGLVWLRSMPGDPAEGRTTLSGKPDGTMQGAMDTLVSEAKRLVEVELVDGVYSVRVMPRRGVQSPGWPAVALSYRGTKLRSILWHAVDELDLLGRKFDQAELQDREVVRWVA